MSQEPKKNYYDVALEDGNNCAAVFSYGEPIIIDDPEIAREFIKQVLTPPTEEQVRKAYAFADYYSQFIEKY